MADLNNQLSTLKSYERKVLKLPRQIKNNDIEDPAKTVIYENELSVYFVYQNLSILPEKKIVFCLVTIITLNIFI